MATEIRRALARLGVMAALSLAVLALAACGSPAEPTEVEPALRAEPATAASTTPESASAQADTAEPETQGTIAPKFTLPNAAGESVSLASFAGEKNVVLVFYRGFW